MPEAYHVEVTAEFALARFFLTFAAVFAVLGLVFALLPSIGPALHRLTRRMVAARVERLDLSLLLDLRTVAVAIAAPDFVCAFQQPHSMARMRVLYTPGPDLRAALLEALRSAGAEVVSLD